MIVKLAQSFRGDRFKRKSRVVHAKRIAEDFLYETQHGWVQGHKGQWLVEIGEGLRCNLDHEAFERSYKPAMEGRRLNDGRALNDKEVERIREDVYVGMYNDRDLDRLFQTIFLQRKILTAMFNLFKREPLRLVSVADPIRNSVLAHFKELVSMDDRPEGFL